MKKLNTAYSIFFAALTLAVLCIFLWWHFRLGQTRYFDVDEFAHLHWAANIARGQLPYKDFLIFFPPGFHMLLAPLLKVGWGTVAPLLWARTAMFVIFVGLVAALVGLFWRVRKNVVFALLAGLFLAFLPLPFDKFLEIRPDTLTVCVAIISMIWQIQWMQTGKGKFAFLSGFFYSSAFFIFTKVAPQLVLASLFVLAWGRVRRDWLGVKLFFAGICIPILVFLVWIWRFADIGTVLYSLFILPVEANRLANQFYMSPSLFFYPNSLFYGMGGWTRGLITNHIVWMVGLFVFIYRLVAPFLATKDTQSSNQKNVWTEALISVTFLVSILSFMYGFPLRHSQYLIPIAVFVSFYAADGAYIVWSHGRSLLARLIYIGAYILLLIFLYNACVEVSQPKVAWTNTEDLQGLQKNITFIPKDAYVFDLIGATVYFRDPYPVCCVPFGQWEGYLSRPLPSLPDALARTHTQYVYDGKLKRVDTLSGADSLFIKKYFGPPVDGLWIAK